MQPTEPFNPMMLMSGSLRNILEQLDQSSSQSGDKQISEEQELFYELIGDMGVTEVMQIFGPSQEYDLLDKYQPQIKKYFTQMQAKKGNAHIIQLMKTVFGTLLLPSEKHGGMVFDGFEPKEVYSEIMNREVEKLFVIISKEFECDEKPGFGASFMNQMNLILGQVAHEISEGLNNGKEDYRIIISNNIESICQIKLPASITPFIQPIIVQTISEHINK